MPPGTTRKHKVFVPLLLGPQALAALRASAEAGDAEAQFILGGMYVTGVGVPQDTAEAVAWYRRAAVAARMTPTDLREAERRARAWHAAHQGMRNRAAPPSDTGREGLIIALGLLGAL